MGLSLICFKNCFWGLVWFPPSRKDEKDEIDDDDDEDRAEDKVKKQEGLGAGFDSTIFLDFLCCFGMSCFKTWGTGSDNENDGEDDAGNTASAEAILRDFKYKLQCTYMEPAMDLRVRS